MTPASTAHTTELLTALADGEADAAGRLFPLVYDELRSLARARLRREGRGHSLQPTLLVHEAYLRMVDQRRASYRSRTHFVAVAARAMQRILVDAARRRGSLKRGGGAQRVALDGLTSAAAGRTVDGADLEAALARLAAHDERMHGVVVMRFLGGLTADETATALGIARSTVAEDWRLARAWLLCELEAGPP